MSGFDVQGLGARPFRPDDAWRPPAPREVPLDLDVGPQDPIVRGGDGQAGGGDGAARTTFGSMLGDAIERVDSLRDDVQDRFEALATGEPVALHDVMMAMGKSDVAFNLMLEVRNKLVDAWEKLSRSVV